MSRALIRGRPFINLSLQGVNMFQTLEEFIMTVCNMKPERFFLTDDLTFSTIYEGIIGFHVSVV